MTTNKLGLLTTKIGSGITPRGGQSVYRDSGTYLIRSQNIYNHKFEKKGLVCISEEIAEKMKSVEIMKEDILINITGDSVARAYIVPDEILPARVNQHVCILRTKSELNPHYLYYFLINPITQNHLLSIAGIGGTRNAITKEMLCNLIIEYPDSPTQEKIVKQLNVIKNKIITIQNQNKILEQMAQAIFKSWFVDFDGVTEFEDSELGQIPKGWSVKKIGDVIELLYGKSLTKENRVHGNIPVYGSSGIVGFHNQSLSTKKGIIVGRKGNVGSVYLSSNSFYAIDTVYYVKTELSLHYVYRNFQNQNFINSDSSVPGLSRDQAYSLPILIPKNVILEKFENMSSSIQITFEKNKDLILALTKTRDALLPKLMSGEIRV